jgi:hypothetical protein
MGGWGAGDVAPNFYWDGQGPMTSRNSGSPRIRTAVVGGERGGAFSGTRDAVAVTVIGPGGIER